MKGGEYQLPDAMRRLTEAGFKLKPGTVSEWLDCGNKEVTVHTNQRVLEYDWAKNRNLVHDDVKVLNATIVPPCFIGKGVVIENSVVGPHVSIGAGSKVTNSVVRNSIIQNNSSILDSILKDSMIGSHANVQGQQANLSLGDFSSIHI
jgi:glucose-1-phosphate thymidylyltransferase